MNKKPYPFPKPRPFPPGRQIPYNAWYVWSNTEYTGPFILPFPI